MGARKENDPLAIHLSSDPADAGKVPDAHTGLPLSVVKSGYRHITAADAVSLADSVVIADPTGSPAPEGLKTTVQASGGTFAGGQAFYYTVTALGGPTGESIGLRTSARATPAANGSMVLNWNAVPGATGYKVYRCNFNASNPESTTPALLVTLGPVTTYTDTGTATGAGAPPTNNGGAFTLTLPDATVAQVGMPYSVRVVGNTANLVTLAATASQTIDGQATVVLGTAAGAQYRAVTVVSDGSNWQIAHSAPAPLYCVQFAALPRGASFPAGATTPLAVLQIPRISQGQTIALWSSANIVPATGTTNLQFTINKCAADGTVADPATQNIAFWNDQQFTVGKPKAFANNWLYSPRQGDSELLPGDYIGLHLNPSGAAQTPGNAMLQAQVGAIVSGYFPAP